MKRAAATVLLLLMLPVASSADPLERARELSWEGAYTESLALYEKLLRAAPDDVALRREYGLVLLWSGREIDDRQATEPQPDATLR